MIKLLSGGRIKFGLSMLGICLLIGVVVGFSEQVSSASNLTTGSEYFGIGGWSKVWPEAAPVRKSRGETGTLEKMIVSSGNVSMDLDVAKLNGAGRTRQSTVQFTSSPDSYFTVLVFNEEFRGPMPSTLDLVPSSTVALPEKLNASIKNLVIERAPFGEDVELMIRDSRTGFTFFEVNGAQFDYLPSDRSISLNGATLQISQEYAEAMGRPADAGTIAGTISISAALRAVEVTTLVDGESRNVELPSGDAPEGTLVPGPDVIVGNLSGLAQFGSAAGTRVGLAVGTDSCNAGQEPLHWFQNPVNDHPLIPQNLYRMSGGTTNDERFEQIGQSQMKHAFTALQNNICNFGCQSSGTGTLLGAGCSDPYGAGLNSGPDLGSRAWVNPFTGVYPRGDSATTPNNSHSGHTHQGPSHRILTEVADLNTTLNPGASYYTEAQYVTPHEYAWCQSHPGQCNMNNNASYRKYTVSGTTCNSGQSGCYSFSPSAATVRTQAAIRAWPGATFVNLQPAPGVDGIGVLAYKVTQTGPTTWHYEYALYNQNMDRGIQSFKVPVGVNVVLSNVGFHAPPQHPGWNLDGTVGSAGYSSTPWATNLAGGYFEWSSETFAVNPNANAVRWGTLYNLRFDANKGPEPTHAVIGFFKTGEPIYVPVMGPDSKTGRTCIQQINATRCP